MANGQDPFEEFKIQKQRARQRARTIGEESAGAIRRRFAALGGISGGAAIKQERIARKEAAQLGEQAIGGIELREAQERQRQRELEQGREFARTEAERARQFAREEATAGREFQRGLFDVQQDFQERQFDFNRKLSGQQLDLQRQGLNLEQQSQAFNKVISAFSVPDHTKMISVLSQLANDPSLPENFRIHIGGFINPTGSAPPPPPPSISPIERQRIRAGLPSTQAGRF